MAEALSRAPIQAGIESHMPEGGVIFSDGVEADALAFTSGSIASVQLSTKRAVLAVKQ
jgi:hypothetical protein